MRYRLLIAALSMTALAGAVCAEEKFEPTVESLRQYECPAWFRDAKFGIYLHWGASRSRKKSHATLPIA